jgi:hypothetical protein
VRLWQSVGLEVCVIGGSDFGPLGEMGAMELHKIFDWAARSPRGPSIRQLCMREGGRSGGGLMMHMCGWVCRADAGDRGGGLGAWGPTGAAAQRLEAQPTQRGALLHGCVGWEVSGQRHVAAVGV